MAKKRSAKRSSKSSPTGRSPNTSAPPVTLAEALALAGISDPEDKPRPPRRAAAGVSAQTGTTRSSRSIAASPASEPSILTLEAERARLHAHREEQLEQRIRDYEATMRILAERGVIAEAPTPKSRKKLPTRGQTRGSARVVTRPLQAIAEGDSWFDYPVPFFGGGLIKRLAGRVGVPILNLAEAGDEVRYMLGVKQRAGLGKLLMDRTFSGEPWDVVLFSGGGNDIVGDPMTLWVRDYERGKSAAQLIDDQRFNSALALVRAGYEDLIALRDRLSPTTHLVFHTYDFAIPDGRGICGAGPWLLPTLEARGYPNSAIRFEVVQEMLRRFAAMLKTLARGDRITVIDGQGLLPPVKDSWHNELHPSKEGFNAFADRFRDELRKLFPGRLP